VRVALAVSTIGRPADLDRLLESVAAQAVAVDRIVVVDQSDGDDVRSVVDRWVDRLPVSHVRSARGVSLGRNTGVAALMADDVDIIGFPDDDVLYRPDTTASVLAVFRRHPDWAAVSGELVSLDGAQRLNFSGAERVLDRRTVWSNAIEATTFVRAADLAGMSSCFEESIGAGASTPWQSGEGTDLLLRLLADGAVVGFSPTVVVEEIARPVATPQRSRMYARGTGWVLRRHVRSSPVYALRTLLAPLARLLMALLQRDRGRAYVYWSVWLGRLEGFTRHTFGSTGPTPPGGP